MGLSDMLRQVRKRFRRKHGDVKSFQQELKAAGGEAGRRSIGTRVVPTEKVVGSVSRWQNLRTDFLYKHGTAMTERFKRVGKAMQQGKGLPPLELYKMKVRRSGEAEEVEVSEYYVVDGHHRVAMAKKLGQDFLDANIVEYKVAGSSHKPDADAQASTPAEAEQPPAAEPAPPSTPAAPEGQAKPDDRAPDA